VPAVKINRRTVHTAKKKQIAVMIKSRSMSMAMIRRVLREVSFPIAVYMKKSHPIICF
jgi:hypothetical protein